MFLLLTSLYMFFTPFGGRPVTGLKNSWPVFGSFVAFLADKYSSIAFLDCEIFSRFSLK